MSNAVDKRIYDIVFAEGGGGNPEEIGAIASVIMNRIDRVGPEKAFKGFSSYTQKSNQYKKAERGDLNTFEKLFYDRSRKIVDNIIENPDQRQPYYFFENVNRFGNPSWSEGLEFKDIGRQRFYLPRSN